MFEPTADGLGVASLRVVEPIRPLLHLHPPAWADPESARRRRSPLPKSLLTVDADRQARGAGVNGAALSWSSVLRPVAHCSWNRRPMILLDAAAPVSGAPGPHPQGWCVYGLPGGWRRTECLTTSTNILWRLQNFFFFIRWPDGATENLGVAHENPKAAVHQEFCHAGVYRRDEKLCKELKNHLLI